jgi:hypothetical protein
MIQIPDPDRAIYVNADPDPNTNSGFSTTEDLFFLHFPIFYIFYLKRNEKFTSNRLWVLQNVFKLNQLVTFIAIEPESR